jgi:hypothetical protein
MRIHPHPWLLPYGAYLTANSSVYYDRRYRPIVRLTFPPLDLSKGGAIGAPAITVCDPKERIEHDSQMWFYKDGTSPTFNRETRKRLEAIVESVPEMRAEIERRELEARKEKRQRQHAFARKCR